MQIRFTDYGRLSPVARNPNPTCASAYPMSWDPNSRGTWWPDPRARHPNVSCAIPSPVTRRPKVTWTGRNALGFDSNRRRRLRHNNLARHNGTRRSSCRHLLGGCGRGHCRNRWRRFIGAANQCERRQRQHPNAYSHNAPFCIIFVSR